MFVKKLSEIADIKAGGTPSRSRPEYWGGEIPWIKISNINAKHVTKFDETITKLGLENSSAKIFEKGTILYTIFATLGRVGILTFDAATNQAIAGIKLIDDHISIDYLYYYLRSVEDSVKVIGNGAAQQNINLGILKNFSIPVPPLEKQNNIVNSLETIEKGISQKKNQLSILDELIKSRFIEMFGLFPDNEKRWNITTIRELATEVKYGTSIKAANDMLGKYKYIRMNNMTDDGELDFTDMKTIDIPDSELPKCSVKKGDLLFNRTNSADKVGKTAVYNEDEQMVLAGFIIRVRLKNTVLPEFLSSFLNTDFSKLMLRKMAKRAVNQANINAQEMQDIKLYLPPIVQQRKFVDFKKQIDKLKFVVQQQIKDLQELLDKKMDEYFGE